MTEMLLQDLRLNEVDVEGALERLSNDMDMYKMILTAFPEDSTMSELKEALKEKNWDEAFTAAHALKGLAGNLGFTGLFYALGELVIIIRAGKVNDMEESFNSVQEFYDDIIQVINFHLIKIVSNDL